MYDSAFSGRSSILGQLLLPFFMDRSFLSSLTVFFPSFFRNALFSFSMEPLFFHHGPFSFLCEFSHFSYFSLHVHLPSLLLGSNHASCLSLSSETAGGLFYLYKFFYPFIVDDLSLLFHD